MICIKCKKTIKNLTHFEKTKIDATMDNIDILGKFISVGIDTKSAMYQEFVKFVRGPLCNGRCSKIAQIKK